MLFNIFEVFMATPAPEITMDGLRILGCKEVIVVTVETVCRRFCHIRGKGEVAMNKDDRKENNG
jgi:hypothetical protein